MGRLSLYHFVILLIFVFAALMDTVRPSVTDANLLFLDSSDIRGMALYETSWGKGGGVAAADYDNDGDVDLFVPTSEHTPNQFYENQGDGYFQEIGVDVGLGSFDPDRTALWFDYDGDARLDLVVGGDCWRREHVCNPGRMLRLYRQESNGTFVDVSGAAGISTDPNLNDGSHIGGISAGDLSGDGLLDFVVARWQADYQVFYNNGDGTFSDVTEAVGLADRREGYWQPILYDFDNDDRLDIFQAVDFRANHLWLNTGAGFFDIGKSAGVDNSWNDMGVAPGDYDNDGDLDLYVTNITNSRTHNLLLENQSLGRDVRFARVGDEAGVNPGGWGWGTTFVDADLDGDLDLAATNGWFQGPAEADRSRFYLNNGDSPTTFDDVTTNVGMDDDYWGSALVAADVDRDGDQDLLQVCNGSGTRPHRLRLIENITRIDRNVTAGADVNDAAGNYLVVKPRLSGPNHRAIGATVRLTIKSGGTSDSDKHTLKMMRPILAGTSMHGQEPAEAFFGLGDRKRVDEVRVRWPGGSESVFTDVRANRTLTVGDGEILFTDVTDTAGVALDGVLNESVAWGDYDNDGDEDLYLTNDGPNNLFRNEGGGLFTDVTDLAGAGNDRFSVGAAFGDLDNDGDLDLYVVNFRTGPDVLYRNDGPTGSENEYVFTDITLDAGVVEERSSRPVALLDFNRDGLLDIFVMSIGENILYENLGDMTFVDVSGDVGVRDSVTGVGIAATDVNNDGWIDVFTGNRSGDINSLYMNRGGTFEDISEAAGIDSRGLGMGVMSLDYDNDLDFDLYWTTWPGEGVTPVPNALFENRGDESFLDVAAATDTTDPNGWGISGNVGDIDLDGWMDMVVTNGFSETTTANVLFRNNAGETFSDVTAQLEGGALFDGRGAAFADYDNDGDLDLIITGGPTAVTRLWRNDTNSGNRGLTLKLRGTASNASAIGARVEVTTDRQITVQEVSGGAGRGSQNSLPLEFGLGASRSAEEIFVRWPSGTTERFGPVRAGRTIEVVEPIGDGTPLAGYRFAARTPRPDGRRFLKIRSGDDAIKLVPNESDRDAFNPARYGGRVEIIAADGEAKVRSVLDAERWQRLADEHAETVAYVFTRGGSRPQPVRRLLIRDGKLRLRLKTAKLNDVVGEGRDPRLVEVRVTVGAARYCLAFGGVLQALPDGGNRLSGAAAPENCDF